MFSHSFSVAQARINLPTLVHDAEAGTPVEITRWGKPVAVLVSADAYRQLAMSRPRFWDAVTAFREQVNVRQLGLDAQDLRGVRDTTPGREGPW